MREGRSQTGDIIQLSTGYIQVANGTTAQRPAAPANGMIRFNTDTGVTEIYQAGSWQNPVFVPRTRLYYADMFDNPVSSDWAVNGLAPATADPLNNALTIRAFDDTLEEGVGFLCTIPTGIASMTLRTKARAAAAPSSGTGVVMRLHYRTIPNNAAVTAWANTTLTTIAIPTNAFYQYDFQTFTLASLGLAPGATVQFELTRQGNATADTLSGDFYLIEVSVEFA
jgi:hypothetical protein